MSPGRRRHDLVLAIYPNTRGFAFTLFEGPLSPVDWGLSELRGKDRNRRCLRRIRLILHRYEPNVAILQDMSENGTRRVGRIRRLNEAIEALANSCQVSVYTYSRAQVRACFASEGPATKHSIAESIAGHISAFERYLPPLRKPWMSEHANMGLFDAAALVLSFYKLAREPKKTD